MAAGGQVGQPGGRAAVVEERPQSRLRRGPSSGSSAAGSPVLLELEHQVGEGRVEVAQVVCVILGRPGSSFDGNIVTTMSY